jgi:RecA-family ATPase
MTTKLKQAAPGKRPEAEKTESVTTQQGDYTPTPEETKDYFQKMLKGLPTAEMRARFEKSYLHIVTDALAADNAAPGLENLLPSLKVIDAATILNTDYPPLAWIVPDYLPPGLTFLIGKPKVGKSWLALQLALSISTGGKVFGRDVQQGRVLYLALEDNERRLKDRMKKQGWLANPGNVEFMLADTFRDQITALNTGGGKRLLKYIERQKYRVVIVDTFSRAIQGDQLDPGEMTEAVGHLQQYALEKNIALIIIDHMPKNTGETNDPIGHIYGSVAKAGVTDTAWGLYKEQGKDGAKLGISGRDLEESLLQLTFDKRGYYWHCEGNAGDIAMTAQRKAILEALQEVGTAQAKEIAEATGQAVNHVRERLNDLANEGKITRYNDGKTVTYTAKP